MLASRAALRMGTGLVTLGSDAETIRRVAPALVEVMGLSLGDRAIDPARVLDALLSRNALAIGPSLIPDDALAVMLKTVLLGPHQVATVIDAGALGALGPDPSWLAARTAHTVLTPHPGEMARVLGTDTRTVQQDRPRAARALAASTRATVVLKGASTVIAEPSGMLTLIARGNPGMATGGTGDVLTGVIGSLLAQGRSAELAACAGAWLHAVAGDRAARAHGGRLIASDLIDQLAHPEDLEGTR
jgi:NAD(P)H-hydrate epimerase